MTTALRRNRHCTQNTGYNTDCGADATEVVTGHWYCPKHAAILRAQIHQSDLEDIQDEAELIADQIAGRGRQDVVGHLVTEEVRRLAWEAARSAVLLALGGECAECGRVGMHMSSCSIGVVVLS